MLTAMQSHEDPDHYYIGVSDVPAQNLFRANQWARDHGLRQL
jgi:hypothetical protein